MNDMLGTLSRDEQNIASRVTSADLLAFLDSQRVTIGPPIRPDGSGWLVVFDTDAHVVTAWGPRPHQVTKLDRRCSTLTEALTLICNYEHLVP